MLFNGIPLGLGSLIVTGYNPWTSNSTDGNGEVGEAAADAQEEVLAAVRAAYNSSADATMDTLEGPRTAASTGQLSTDFESGTEWSFISFHTVTAGITFTSIALFTAAVFAIFLCFLSRCCGIFSCCAALGGLCDRRWQTRRATWRGGRRHRARRSGGEEGGRLPTTVQPGNEVYAEVDSTYGGSWTTYGRPDRAPPAPPARAEDVGGGRRGGHRHARAGSRWTVAGGDADVGVRPQAPPTYGMAVRATQTSRSTVADDGPAALPDDKPGRAMSCPPSPSPSRAFRVMRDRFIQDHAV